MNPFFTRALQLLFKPFGKKNFINISGNNNFIIQDAAGLQILLQGLSPKEKERIEILEQEIKELKLTVNSVVKGEQAALNRIRLLETELNTVQNILVEKEITFNQIINNYKSTPKSEFPENYEQAIGSFLRGNIEHAKELLEINETGLDLKINELKTNSKLILDEKDKLAHSYLLKAQLLALDNKHEQAESILNKLILAYPSWLTFYNSGEYYKTRKDFKKAEKLYSQANSFSSNNFQSAISYAMIGYMNDLLFSYAKAETALNYSLSLLRYLVKSDDEKTLLSLAKTLNFFGILMNDLNRLDKAKEFYLEAIEIRNKFYWKLLGEEKSAHADSKHNLAIIYRKKEQYESSEAYNLEALEIYRDIYENDKSLSAKSNLGGSYNNLGVLYFYQNEDDQAAKYWFQALEIRKEISELNPQSFISELGETLNNIGNLYARKNDIERTEHYYTEALLLKKERALLYPTQYSISFAKTAVNFSQFYANLNINKAKSLKLAKDAYCSVIKFAASSIDAKGFCEQANRIVLGWKISPNNYLKC